MTALRRDNKGKGELYGAGLCEIMNYRNVNQRRIVSQTACDCVCHEDRGSGREFITF